MELQIHGRDLELDERTRAYIARKVNRLGRHLPGITMATIELVRENTRAQSERIVAQATLNIDGTLLRGEERGANAMAAIDLVIDVLDRRVERYKDKVYRSKQAKRAGKTLSMRSGEMPDAPLEEDEAADEETEAAHVRVVRVKRFAIKPMMLNEATFQMELLGHDFFLFLSSETGQYNVLYRRRDGDYGLIQPEPM